MFEDEATSAGGRGGASWLPFGLYLLAWVMLAIATFALLKDDAAVGALLWSADYGRVAAAALVLAALGPATSIAVWVVTRASRPADARAGLLADSLVKGGATAFIGTALWLVTLLATDMCCRGA